MGKPRLLQARDVQELVPAGRGGAWGDRREGCSNSPGEILTELGDWLGVGGEGTELLAEVIVGHPGPYRPRREGEEEKGGWRKRRRGRRREEEGGVGRMRRGKAGGGEADFLRG